MAIDQGPGAREAEVLRCEYGCSRVVLGCGWAMHHRQAWTSALWFWIVLVFHQLVVGSSAAVTKRLAGDEAAAEGTGTWRCARCNAALVPDRGAC